MRDSGMTEEGDIRQQLGELIASGKARAKQMDRIEKTMSYLAETQNETRMMVREDRATVRAVKWTVGVVVAAVSLLGIDWWNR